MNGHNASRFISLDSSDLLIEALVAEKNHAGTFHRVSFRASVIDHLIEVHEKVSAIVLKSNIIIPVAMPFKALQGALYESNFRTGPFLDLTPLTGQAVKDTLVPKLEETFNAEALNGAAAVFQISVYAKDNWNSRRTFTFPSDFVEYYEHNPGNLRQTLIKLKTGFSVKEMSKLLVDIPIDKFSEAMEKARKNQVAQLNLFDQCDESSSLLPPAAACKRYVP